MDNTDLLTCTCLRKLSQNLRWYIITFSEINIVLAAGLMSACDKTWTDIYFYETGFAYAFFFYETGFAYVNLLRRFISHCQSYVFVHTERTISV